MITNRRTGSHFESDPEVLEGAIVVKGTRITPELVRICALQAVKETWPYLTTEQIYACFRRVR